MKIVCFASGTISDYAAIAPHCAGADMVICCDGGLGHANALGLFPHTILGDFDSIDKHMLLAYEAQGANILTYPTKKDATDTALGVAFALTHNPTELVILGGMGTRFDHTMANVHTLLEPMARGICATLIDEHNKIHLTNSLLTLTGAPNRLVSLMPLSTNVEGITTQGLAYPLNGETLTMGTSRGVSNVCIGEKATIQVATGVLMVIESTD